MKLDEVEFVIFKEMEKIRNLFGMDKKSFYEVISDIVRKIGDGH